MVVKLITRIIHLTVMWIGFFKYFFILMMGLKIIMMEAMLMNAMMMETLIMAVLTLTKNGSDE